MEAIDDILLDSIESFRAIQKGELAMAADHRITWARASASFDFEVVARNLPIEYPEQTLRLLNGYYPSGQPRPGDWVKLIEQ